MSKRPIIKLNLRDDLPRIRLTLESYQHAMLELALRYILERIEKHEFVPLDVANVHAVNQMRSTLFGIQAQMRTADNGVAQEHFWDLELTPLECTALSSAIEFAREELPKPIVCVYDMPDDVTIDDIVNALSAVLTRLPEE